MTKPDFTWTLGVAFLGLTPLLLPRLSPGVQQAIFMCLLTVGGFAAGGLFASQRALARMEQVKARMDGADEAMEQAIRVFNFRYSELESIAEEASNALLHAAAVVDAARPLVARLRSEGIASGDEFAALESALARMDPTNRVAS